MTLTKKDISELKKIWKKSHGYDLTDNQAEILSRSAMSHINCGIALLRCNRDIIEIISQR